MSLVDRLLSPIVPLSFGAPGFRLRQRSFTPLPRLEGRHVVITGANSGIGRAAAEALAGLGARITMVCRDRGRAETARDEIVATIGPGANVAIERCDVARLPDVVQLAARLRDPIDVLVHNAGVLPPARMDTAEGFELAWATHVVGPHLLSRLLRPRLSPTSRIVLVSSGGMYLAPLGEPGAVPEPYDGVHAYALTKRAQVTLAALWAQFEPHGPCVFAMHPGWADTVAVRTSLPRFYALTRTFLRDAAGGADTVAWLAASTLDALVPGGFYFDRRQRSPHLLPWQHDRPARRAALWQWCNAVTEDALRSPGT